MLLDYDAFGFCQCPHTNIFLPNITDEKGRSPRSRLINWPTMFVGFALAETRAHSKKNPRSEDRGFLCLRW